jgi:hypothetical protein
MPGSWGHLAARFVDAITARGLTPAEVRIVQKWSGEGPMLSAFLAQPPLDQRHGFDSASYVATRAPDRMDLIRAALLHDVGKRHAGLGPLGRVIASILIRLHFPLGPRFALYRDHGRLAAAELAGDDKVVVEFARHHHGSRPPDVDPGEWDLLLASDRARSPFGADRGGQGR